MNTQTETRPVFTVAEKPRETENPMQACHCGKVTESIEVTADVVFTARRLEVREEAGPLFVP